MPCEAQIDEMAQHSLVCPMFNKEEFARLGEEWKLTFEYTHIRPNLKERHHTLSLLQRNHGDFRLVVFDNSRPHGCWHWNDVTNQIDIHFKYSGSNEHAFPHQFKCISKQGSTTPSWCFEKIDLEREEGKHWCYLSTPQYERMSNTITYSKQYDDTALICDGQIPAPPPYPKPREHAHLQNPPFNTFYSSLPMPNPTYNSYWRSGQHQRHTHTALAIQHPQRTHPTCKYYWKDGQWHIFHNWLPESYQRYLAIHDQNESADDKKRGEEGKELVWI